MNFCKDCKHYIVTEGVGYRICTVQNHEAGADLVTGRTYPAQCDHVMWHGHAYETCSSRRNRMPDCPDYELFVAEPKPRKWWQVWREK